MGVLNIYDIMLAQNVPTYIATRKRVLKVTLQVATPGAESAVCDCLVGFRDVARSRRHADGSAE